VLALHVRRRRLWHRRQPLSQAHLAELARIPVRRVRRLEKTTSLPRDVEALVRIALVLGVRIEALIDPRALRSVMRDVEWLRREMPRRNRAR
jgi:transcriptional regulator with XRE-family HTH domain